MKKTVIYPVGLTAACSCAAESLQQMGYSLTDHPEPEITHILMDVPSIRSGMTAEQLAALLSMLPKDAVIVGGNLDHPVFSEHRKLDLLQDADYLAQNAAITADCAVRVAAAHLKMTFADSSVLILGWGRIGKCLAKFLHKLDCTVTIAARKETDRAMIRALGYAAIDYDSLRHSRKCYQILFNTVPTVILSEEDLSHFGNCIKIELASRCGLIGEDVILARGLPGIYAPQASGKLIAKTVPRLWKEDHS